MLAQTATAVPDAGTPHPGLGSQVSRKDRSLLLPQRRERPRFGLRQGDAGVWDRQLHHQRHIRLPPCPLRRSTGHIWKRGHPRSFAAAGRHVDGREWNRRSGWSIKGKRCRHRFLSATGRIFGEKERRRRSARSPGPRRGHWGGHHPSFTVADRTVDGRRHRRST